MSEAFDPYLHWLGIRDPQRPPNHYRLLGVDLFESDTEVLANAADRQMSHLRTFQGGRHAAISQSMLNELAAAKLCLLNPPRKAEYDTWLRQELAGLGPAAPGHAAQGGVMMHRSGSRPPPAVTPNDRDEERRARLISIGIAVLTAVALVLVGLIVLLTHRHAGSDELPEPTTAAERPRRSTSPVAQSAVPARPQPAPVPAIEPAPATQPQPAVEAVPQPKRPLAAGAVPGTKPETTPEMKPETKPETKPEAHPELPPPTMPPVVVGPPSAPDIFQPAPAELLSELQAQASPDSAPAPKPKPVRVAVPGADVQAKSLAVIRDLYKEQYAVVEKPSQRQQFAELLLSKALETNDDPAARYAALSEAREQALESGTNELYLRVVETLAELYLVDPLALKTQDICQAPKGSRAPSVNQAVTILAKQAAKEAAAQEKFDDALRLVDAGTAMAKKAKDLDWVRRMVALRRDLDAQRQQYLAFAAAGRTLSDHPNDPEANLVQGRYLCFLRNDWSRGIPLMLKGRDPALAALARAEQEQPTTPAQMVALGDRWWDAAAAADAETQPYLLLRAGVWYGKAQPSLTGLTKVRVERRMQEISTATADLRR